MRVVLRAPKEPATCERSCGPAVRPRWLISSLLPYQQAAPRGYPAQPCPNCRSLASWVHGDLHCIACSCTFVPDRLHRAELVELSPNAYRTAPCCAFERVLRGAPRRMGRVS